ncbi:uncharacterized protein LOC141595147 [Silene latifolia]|uniref:uncharacterized protein LOC141595147 n=1 Tax=Silene latifolia TaxID=37657 RepID=UPI003D77C28A
MIISSWNTRGFNDLIKQQEVRGYLAMNKIEVFGLLETRVRMNNAAATSRLFSSYGILNNYSHHYNERIWVFHSTRLVTLLSSRIRDQLIHLELLYHVSNKVVHVSFVYGSNDADTRQGLWDELRQLANIVADWIVLGDFNIGYACEHTWTNKQDVGTRVWSKLDRVLTNAFWLVDFPHTQSPTKGNAMFILFAKLKIVRKQLIVLHKNNYSGLAAKVKQARESLETCQKQVQLQPLDIHLLTQEKYLLEKYWTLRKTERSSLIQRAKIHDINYNDAANSYFYAKIAIRKHQSIIGKIKDKDGIIREGMEDVNNAFVDYNQWLLGTPVATADLPPEALEGPRIQDTDWDSLCRPVEEMEIRKALFSIAYFRTGVMSKQANTTLLELIPKKPVVTSVMDYRPIACCIVLYKTVSKILFDRLKPYLPTIVGKEQGAFVAGRYDLMIFVIEDSPSVNVVSDSLDLFANMSGLRANPEETNIYMGGIRDDARELILRDPGYVEGTFPFRYLGVPLNEGKLNKGMFADLLSKVQSTLNNWSTHRSSYVGKIHLINTVIFGMERGAITLKKSLLGINASSAKWIWEIEVKSESVWSAWNYKYNIKTADFWAMDIKPYHSESWRSILIVRNELITRTGSIEGAKAPAAKISWARGVWNRAVLPKHGFIMVLAMQGKLATVDKLNQKGQCIMNRCILCETASESHQHLFFNCTFANTVWIGVL